MDLVLIRNILWGVITIGGIAIFFIEQRINKNSDKEKIELKKDVVDLESNQKEIKVNQDEINFKILKQISELQRQIDLSKNKDSLFEIGDYKMTYDEINTYLKKQTEISNSLLNRALAFYSLEQLTKSEKLFLDALETYPKNPEKKALIYSYLGELYLRLQGKLPEAKRNSFLAYNFYKEKKKEGSIEYLFEFGNITSNLGRIFKKETDYKIALNYYNESVKVRKKLAKIDPKKYLIDLGSVYNNIGVLYREKPEFGNCELMYLKALEIKRKAAKYNLNYLPAVAKTLNNLGNLYNKKENGFLKAEIYFEEAIDICQFIVDNGNVEYVPLLAHYQSGLAFAFENLFVKIGKSDNFKKSEVLFLKAIKNYELIENLKIYLKEYSNCLHNLGGLYKVGNKNKKSEKYYKEALEIREKLAISKIPVDEVMLADTQLSLALLYTENIPNKVLAVKYANDSLKKYERNLDFRDANYWRQVCVDIINYWKNIK